MKKTIALLTLLLILVPVLLYAQSVPPTVEREYIWYAEEKLTISDTVIQLSSEEYGYVYGPTRIVVEALGSGHDFVLNEVITDGTTAAMGTLKGYDDATTPTYLDIQILYNGLDSADFDANDVLTGAGGGTAAVEYGYTYTRGTSEAFPGQTYQKKPEIAEIHVLDNSIIWTYNGTTPIYSATDSLCLGRKQYEGDTFYLFGSTAIKNFKALRSSATDAIITCRYGR